MTARSPGAATGGAVLLYFWAPWCGPCRLLSPLVRDLASAGDDAGRIIWVAVDEEPERVRAFEVHNVPTLIVLHGARIVARRAGALTPSQFQTFVAEAGLGPAASPTQRTPQRTTSCD